jgi:Zn-dependent protease
MNCQKCGQEVLMPFQCPYCGGQFCGEHRLPENHACPRLGLAHSQRQESVADGFTPRRDSYQYSISFGQPPRQTKGRVYMSPREIKHLLPAALLIAAIGVSIVLYNQWFGSNLYGMQYWGWTAIAVFAVLLTFSFLIHEIAHKVVAQQNGLWAEFRLTMWGAIITAVSIVLPFKLISPGAVMISGPARLKEVGKISVAGPSTNMILAALFLGLGLFTDSYVYAGVFLMVAFVNATMAVFNLIPFGILDGYKIYSWNKKAWVLAFAVAVVLALPFYI